MNFAKFQSLVEHRTGFRTMENPTASGEYFSDSCGDLYTFFLKVGPGDVIEDVSYFTTGCGFGTATCSLLVELAKGKTIDEALAITDAEIEDYRAKRSAGAITDAMLEEARATVAAAAAASRGTGTTEEDAKAGPKVLEDAGVLEDLRAGLGVFFGGSGST